MKTLITIISLFVLLVSGSQQKCDSGPTPTPATPSIPNCGPLPQSAPNQWSLVFSDEFNNDDQFDDWNDPWSTGYPEGQTHGDELQYYTRYDKSFPTQCDKGGINHVVSNGTLKLITKEETGNFEVWKWDNQGQFYTTCDPYEYTSGMLFTKDKFLYGYYEINAKIPNEGKVLWPAFWLWAGGGEEYREIDIFEFCCDIPNKVGFNMHIASALDNGYVHTLTWTNQVPIINSYPGEYILTNPPNVSDGFHTYGLMWTPNKVEWYVDGTCRYRVTKHTPAWSMNAK